MVDFTTVTEVSGETIGREQLQRMCNRYFWAAQHVINKEVLEVACGAGQGLKYLSTLTKRLVAGDVCESLVKIARKNAGEQVDVKQLNAEAMPLADNSFDVILIFEAIYYLANPEDFLHECSRLLRPGGKLLITTANKDLYSFNPSPYSHTYFGVTELKSLLNKHGFSTTFLGGTPLSATSLRQKLLRPIKKLAVQFNLIPKTMKGKRLLKKLFFGETLIMPDSLTENTAEFIEPSPIADNLPNKKYKVIYCEATLNKEA